MFLSAIFRLNGPSFNKHLTSGSRARRTSGPYPVRSHIRKSMDYYYLIPQAIIIFVVISRGIPDQSDQAREISKHLTKAEHRAAIKSGVLWGSLICFVVSLLNFTYAFIFAPIFFGAHKETRFIASLVVPLICVVLFMKWCPHVITKSQQRYLASTEWAKSQGIKADDIQVFKSD
jgi:hypothetical protein